MTDPLTSLPTCTSCGCVLGAPGVCTECRERSDCDCKPTMGGRIVHHDCPKAFARDTKCEPWCLLGPDSPHRECQRTPGRTLIGTNDDLATQPDFCTGYHAPNGCEEEGVNDHHPCPCATAYHAERIGYDIGKRDERARIVADLRSFNGTTKTFPGPHDYATALEGEDGDHA